MQKDLYPDECARKRNKFSSCAELALPTPRSETAEAGAGYCLRQSRLRRTPWFPARPRVFARTQVRDRKNIFSRAFSLRAGKEQTQKALCGGQ